MRSDEMPAGQNRCNFNFVLSLRIVTHLPAARTGVDGIPTAQVFLWPAGAAARGTGSNNVITSSAAAADDIFVILSIGIALCILLSCTASNAFLHTRSDIQTAWRDRPCLFFKSV